MAVTQMQGAPPGESRMKSIATPVAAGALGIVATVVGLSVLGAPEQAPSPAGIAPSAAVAPAEPPQAGAALPGVAFDQPAPGNLKMGMEIVVKFKDDAKVKDIIDAFWRDQTSAKAKFEAWKAGRPEFANLKLDRVTYSNELVLVHDGSGTADARLPAMREIAKKLGSVADISYAEPNITAQPGGQ